MFFQAFGPNSTQNTSMLLQNRITKTKKTEVFRLIMTQIARFPCVFPGFWSNFDTKYAHVAPKSNKKTKNTEVFRLRITQIARFPRVFPGFWSEFDNKYAHVAPKPTKITG